MFDKTIEKWLQISGGHKPSEFTADGDKVQLSVNLIQEELDELKEAIKNNDHKEVIDALVDLKWVINNVIFYTGIKEEELHFNEQVVRKSNFSKFCKNEDEAKLTVELYRMGNHPDKPKVEIECYYEQFGNVYIVRRKEDNKVLKNMNYQPAVIVTSNDLFDPPEKYKPIYE